MNTITLTDRERRKSDRMEREELAILLEVACRFWHADVWPPRWDAWLAWRAAHRGEWLGLRRAFGVWLRMMQDADDLAMTQAKADAAVKA